MHFIKIDIFNFMLNIQTILHTPCTSNSTEKCSTGNIMHLIPVITEYNMTFWHSLIFLDLHKVSFVFSKSLFSNTLPLRQDLSRTMSLLLSMINQRHWIKDFFIYFMQIYLKYDIRRQIFWFCRFKIKIEFFLRAKLGHAFLLLIPWSI